MNKEATAIQQAITMVRSRIDSIDETLMGKHTIHHLQQVERRLYDLLEEEKEQIINARIDGDENYTLVGNKRKEYAEQYYNETFKPIK
jgi:hypothetical protein